MYHKLIWSNSYTWRSQSYKKAEASFDFHQSQLSSNFFLRQDVFVVSFFLLSLLAGCNGKRPICKLGFYIDRKEGCMPCPIGNYQPLKNQKGCRPCPNDSITIKAGQSFYKKCGEKRYKKRIITLVFFIWGVGASNVLTDTCEICPSGTRSYSRRNGWSTCLVQRSAREMLFICSRFF